MGVGLIWLVPVYGRYMRLVWHGVYVKNVHQWEWVGCTQATQCRHDYGLRPEVTRTKGIAVWYNRRIVLKSNMRAVWPIT